MAKKIAVLGGGVGGLTAAHELVERGFTVDLYEARQILGGKARSMPVPGTGTKGREDLPGEHGFRFFPGFYRHIPDTMRRIPFGSQTVAENLIEARQIQIARMDQKPLVMPTRFSATPADLAQKFKKFFPDSAGLTLTDLKYFAERLLVLLTSCEERRLAEYEQISWWDFVGAEERSVAFRKFCADGVTRSLVAAKAREMSTRTGGYILLQLLFDLSRPGAQVDRVLNGPTNDVWINPWVDHLRKLGVTFHHQAEVVAFECDKQRVTSVKIRQGDSTTEIQADYYVAAFPVEVMERLATYSMARAEPKLAFLHRLRRAWMNGIQFYLDTDISLVHGHTLYLDSPWALTSVSQCQFWPGFDIQRHGDGKAKGILSVDISDWDTAGFCGKPARECTPEEIKDEVWCQLRAHLGGDVAAEVAKAKVLAWFLDPAVRFSTKEGESENREQILINTVGSLASRPDAVTGISNLFIASDYARTYTDLATMEGANEAARRAVNGILATSGSSAKVCAIYPLAMPSLFSPLCRYDQIRFRQRLAHDPRLIRFSLAVVVPLWRISHLLWRGLWLILSVCRWLTHTFVPESVGKGFMAVFRRGWETIFRVLEDSADLSTKEPSMKALWGRFASDPELGALIGRHQDLCDFLDTVYRRSMSDETKKRAAEAQSERLRLEADINAKITERIEGQKASQGALKQLGYSALAILTLMLSFVSLWTSYRIGRQDREAVSAEQVHIQELESRLRAIESARPRELASPVRVPGN